MIIASIDIGSNTVLLLIAEVNFNSGKLITLREEQRLPRISEGLIPGKKISSKAETRLFSVLKEYSDLIMKYNCEKVLLNGTNAFRIASNSDEIKDKIKNEFNFDLKILTGKGEAELAFKGTQEYGNNKETRLVIDIGGGSTEIIYGNEKIFFSHSFNTGVVSISEKYFNLTKPSFLKLSLIDKYLGELFKMLRSQYFAPCKTIALAGTPVTLACIYQKLSVYRESEVEGLILGYQDINELYSILSKLSPKEILKLYSEIVNGREDLILSGTIILLYLMKILNLEEVIVSTKGIRYGAVLNFISGKINYDDFE